MKNKLITFLAISILIVGCVVLRVAAAGLPEETAAQQEEVEQDDERPLMSPAAPSIQIPSVILESAPIEEELEEEIISDDFPIAAQVWNAMKAKGWSDRVCAGIIGNMMAECGGMTLNLTYDAIGDSGSSFGLCQWHNGRKNNLLKNYGTSIEAQIDFLADEMGDPNSFFSDLEDVHQIAYEFCVKFERPKNKEQKGIERKALAQTAFEYFVK